MARLPDDFQLIALGLLSAADDHGYFRADAEIVRADVAPYREDLARISEALEKLSDVGWIELASHPEQGRLGRITKWERHQRVDHPSPSRLEHYFLAINSRASREKLAPDQGTGNREQGTGNREGVREVESGNGHGDVLYLTTECLRTRLNHLFTRNLNERWPNDDEHLLAETARRPNVMEEMDSIEAMFQKKPTGLSTSPRTLMQKWLEKYEISQHPERWKLSGQPEKRGKPHIPNI